MDDGKGRFDGDIWEEDDEACGEEGGGAHILLTMWRRRRCAMGVFSSSKGTLG